MNFGMNVLMWTDTLDDARLPLLDMVKEYGFDTVELPIFDIDAETACGKWGKRCDELGLQRTATSVRGNPDANPASPDPAIRRRGVEENLRTIDCGAAAGVKTIAGPFHSGLGVFSGAGPTDDEWKYAVDSMRETAEYAAKVNIRLGLEYLNRYECYLLNTAADGARFVRDVNHPSCGMMFDTFHSHIEEKSIPDAIRALRDCLVHVHISENDRSTPGEGNVHWDQVFDTLHEIGYDGFMVIEAFGLSLPKLIPATKIWRRMYDTEEKLARNGLAFMKSEVAKRW
ncbi:MAG: sugar phosphate isomerase/epimerase family protein [Planctomycetia bacterium]|nr:sugar phosphate isomerase/epimerase family protein [Planctomycetia bacterium]